MKNYDTRDLEEELNELLEAKEDGEYYDQDRLKELEDLKESLENDGWESGINLIHENNFKEYAEEFFDDCYLGSVPKQVKYYIDYDGFAEDLKQDYNEVVFEGETYFYE